MKWELLLLWSAYVDATLSFVFLHFTSVILFFFPGGRLVSQIEATGGSEPLWLTKAEAKIQFSAYLALFSA
jgi:hypothetical protein